VVRFLPALNIGPSELQEGLGTVEQVLRELDGTLLPGRK
jgi:acetylornithine/succinyldiaminopimelate/putrescine aminotransferase